MAKTVTDNPFIPLKWMKDHPGMQGTEYFNEDGEFSEAHFAKAHWLRSRKIAVEQATALNDAGVTKQLCNRLLEPFMWHKVLVTATEWENFFALRADPAAEIHMQHVAELMLKCMNESVPKKLDWYHWHIPYNDKVFKLALDYFGLADLYESEIEETDDDVYSTPYKVRVSTAMCAQVSYTVVGEDGKPLDWNKLIALHDRLAAGGHWSPFEHCAIPIPSGTLAYSHNKGWFGNFRGWKQYRKTFNDENRKDSRLLKPKI
jgi:thymidylate synthase ThyX